MIEVMDGIDSKLSLDFLMLFCCGFVALQVHADTFLTLVEITCTGSTFKCFEGKDHKEILENIRSRFCLHLDKESTISFAMDLIHQATTSYGTAQYDFFQYISNGIAT
jgi:phosphatidylinositol 4-kinase